MQWPLPAIALHGLPAGSAGRDDFIEGQLPGNREEQKRNQP